MSDCVEGKVEELALEEGVKPSAAEMRSAKSDCKEEAETAFLDAGGRESDFKKARALSSRTRAIDSLEDCIADAVPDPKTASRRDIVNARTTCLADAQEKFEQAGGQAKAFKKALFEGSKVKARDELSNCIKAGLGVDEQENRPGKAAFKQQRRDCDQQARERFQAAGGNPNKYRRVQKLGVRAAAAAALAACVREAIDELDIDGRPSPAAIKTSTRSSR